MPQCQTHSCRGSCRCEYQYAITLKAGVHQAVPINTPLDNGCRVILESSELIIRCKCCPVTIATVVDPLRLGDCIHTHLDIDMSDLDNFFIATVDWKDLARESCSYRYQLNVNGSPYLAGVLNIDWQFAS